MIFSENRFPLFRIMLNPTCHGGGKNEMNSAASVAVQKSASFLPRTRHADF
jgi:hypothetical protein